VEDWLGFWRGKEARRREWTERAGRDCDCDCDCYYDCDYCGDSLSEILLPSSLSLSLLSSPARDVFSPIFAVQFDCVRVVLADWTGLEAHYDLAFQELSRQFDLLGHVPHKMQHCFNLLVP